MSVHWDRLVKELGYADDDAWTRMVVLYETEDFDEVREMERALIQYVQEANFRTEIANERPGGEGLVADRTHYWVYVALGERRSASIGTRRCLA
jgi:hypothetical protein